MHHTLDVIINSTARYFVQRFVSCWDTLWRPPQGQCGWSEDLVPQLAATAADFSAGTFCHCDAMVLISQLACVTNFGLLGSLWRPSLVLRDWSEDLDPQLAASWQQTFRLSFWLGHFVTPSRGAS